MDRPEFVLFRDTWGERVNTAMKIRGSIKWRISLPPEMLIAYKLCYTELAIIQIYLFETNMNQNITFLKYGS